jgi:lysosomal Pro-X carboxypeptidase
MKQYGVTPRPTWLKDEYGSTDIATSASRIIFSNGLLDPWSAGGFLHDLSGEFACFYIPIFESQVVKK